MQDLKQTKGSLKSANRPLQKPWSETLIPFFKLDGDLDGYRRIQNVQSDIVNRRPSKQSTPTFLWEMERTACKIDNHVFFYFGGRIIFVVNSVHHHSYFMKFTHFYLLSKLSNHCVHYFHFYAVHVSVHRSGLCLPLTIFCMENI